jgi:hypothetical protein
MALGGSASTQGTWTHLNAGTYLVAWKADDGGSLSGEALMRHRVGSPDPNGTYTNAGAPIVALIDHAGTDVEELPAGDYVLVVSMVEPKGWTLTVTPQ